MALIQVNYSSKALFRTVPMNVILPADRFDTESDRYLNGEWLSERGLFLQAERSATKHNKIHL